MNEKKRVSLIGLGSMGTAMATRLLEQGFDLTVWNRSPRGIDELLKQGARTAELDDALSNPIVISFLSNDEAALGVFDDDRVSQFGSDTVHINMSTLSPTATRTLADRHSQKGIGYVAAPVLGRPIAITNGTLLVVAAGNAKDIQSAQVVLDKIAARVWIVGEDHAMSSVVKLGVNYNLIHALQAIGESISLVESAGVDANTFVEILTHTAFTGSAYAGYGPMIANRRYSPPGFSMALGLKDIKLIEDAAADQGLKLPVAPILHELFETALRDEELTDLDWSAVAEVTRQRKIH